MREPSSFLLSVRSLVLWVTGGRDMPRNTLARAQMDRSLYLAKAVDDKALQGQVAMPHGQAHVHAGFAILLMAGSPGGAV